MASTNQEDAPMSEAKETGRIFGVCYPMVATGVLVGTALISALMIG
jgi:hypothetical protein